MKHEELAAIKERCEKATAGPWYGYEERESSAEGHAVSTGPSNLFTIGISNQDAFDADFIAHARTDIPALVAEVERLRKVVEAAKAVREHLPTVDTTKGAARHSSHAIKSNALHAALDALEAAAEGGE